MIVADTSVLVPAVLASHEAHEPCHDSAALVDASVGHVLIEMYSVLTRLPQPYTVIPVHAAQAVRSYAGAVVTLTSDEYADLIDRFAGARIAGGSTYDALVAATAVRHGAALLTRDERAASTYERLGADVRWVAT